MVLDAPDNPKSGSSKGVCSRNPRSPYIVLYTVEEKFAKSAVPSTSKALAKVEECNGTWTVT